MHRRPHYIWTQARILCPPAFCCFAVLSGGAADAQPAGALQAGAATSNITPPLGGPIVGGWAPIEAANIHDELRARCLVLDDGNTRLAIAVCDNLGLPREVCDEAKRLINEATEMPNEHIMISGTHTHSAVSARGGNRLVPTETLTDYQQFIATRIADGVRCAINNLEPARIGFGSAQEPSQVFNRRWYLEPGPDLRNPFGGEDKVRMNPGRGNPNLVKPAGPIDPEIAFVSVQSTDGRPIALLANYSLHYVGGVGRGDVSADYFAMFADRIQQLTGADRLEPAFVGIMSNGTSGDINNIDFSRKAERREPYEKMREVADLVAQGVFDALESVEYRDSVDLGAGQEELTLDVRKPSDELVEYLHGIQEKPKDAEPYHQHEKTYANRVLQLVESPDEVSVILQAFRVGDIAIASIPFETFAEIGLELKEKSPFAHTFTISHANGSYGYLPTPEQHKLGGYETWLGTNVVELDASDKITRTLLSLFDSLE